MKLLTLTIVGVFVGIVALGLGLFGAIKAINAHCVAKYDYKPISTGRTFLMLIPYALLLLAFIFLLVGNVNVVPAVYLSVGLAVFMFVAVGFHIAKHTSFSVAIASIILLATVGFIIALILLFIYNSHISRKSDSRSG
jgi:hypothetical protein